MYDKCDTVNNQIRTKSLVHEMKHHYSEDNRNNNLHHLKIPTILNYQQRTQTTRQHRGLVNLHLRLRNPTEKRNAGFNKFCSISVVGNEHLFSFFGKYSMSFGNQILE